MISSDNFVDSSFGQKGKSQDISSPSSSKEVCVRLVRRQQSAPRVGQDETSWVGDPRVNWQRLILQDEDDKDIEVVI